MTRITIDQFNLLTHFYISHLAALNPEIKVTILFSTPQSPSPAFTSNIGAVEEIAAQCAAMTKEHIARAFDIADAMYEAPPTSSRN